VVTENGVGVAVILDVETFEALRGAAEASSLLNDLRGALAEADAGELTDHGEVMAGAVGRFNRSSPAAPPETKP
jgi:PHD/YefM family antitoxin component YafN of YafNO toxin-antitoxin module